MPYTVHGSGKLIACDFIEAERLGNGSTPDMTVISLTDTTVQVYCWRLVQR